MRKADLVSIISDKSGVPKVDVLVSLEMFFKEVKSSLANGENVFIRGFGSFVVKKRAKNKPAKIFVDHVKLGANRKGLMKMM
ncbi:MAG: HU family DNA-binding protein [Saprospiraceae bacterium]|nr:HU family DNA-binding protein [Candidatus Vicinibacter affinis]